MGEILDNPKVYVMMPNTQHEISDPSVMAIKPVVSVWMVTYNHAPYIAESIEGVISQKTDFPIELIIGEDCSTDNTRSIVLKYQRRYPQLIRVIYSDRNVGMTRNVWRVFEAARANYIAFCDGDDVWIDDRKLDKQVSVLKSEPECSIIFHSAEIFRVGKGRRPQPHRPRSHRRMCVNHAVELAAEPDRRQSSTRNCGRLHDGAQANRTCTAQCHSVCRSDG